MTETSFRTAITTVGSTSLIATFSVLIYFQYIFQCLVDTTFSAKPYSLCGGRMCSPGMQAGALVSAWLTGEGGELNATGCMVN